jgi:hypothetical protein
VKAFRQNFDVYTSPDKLSFTGFSGSPYSFDLSGVYEGVEVFVECKGYRDATGILDGYREFLAKAYCTSVQATRHQRDLFWFATNVPFGSSIGRRLCSADFIRESLSTAKPERANALLNGAHIDTGHVESLSRRVAVAIFTDSFVKVMGTLYRFRRGDTLWSVVKLIHGGRIPLSHFEPISASVRLMNDLDDPNRIRAGLRLHLPWFGIRDDDAV